MLGPLLIALLYLAATALACLPLFTQPDSPLSGVLAFVLTLPWSVLVGIPIAILWPDLVSSRSGILSVVALEALVNAVLIYWLMGKADRGGPRLQPSGPA